MSTFPSVGEILKKYSQDIMDALAKNLQAEDKIATGNLIQSIKFPVKVFGTKYVATLSMDDYWKFVEEGRKPGKFPPIDKILQWTVEKGLTLNPLSNRRKKLIRGLKHKKLKKAVKQISKEKLRKSLAFLIGRNIAAKGIAPTHFASKVMTQTLIDNLRKDIAKAAKRDIVVELKSQLNLK